MTKEDYQTYKTKLSPIEGLENVEVRTTGTQVNLNFIQNEQN